MFAYCNDNFVNQIDPEGTDAYWLQFEKAVNMNIAIGTVVGCTTSLLLSSIHTPFFGDIGVAVGIGTNLYLDITQYSFGHTSLLLQDGGNNWWYFYWSGREAYLRFCGGDDFANLMQLNAFLTGFDARPNHNQYTYATDVIVDSEDVNYLPLISKYYVKCHNKGVTKMEKLYGDFSASYNYAYNLLKELYLNSDANQFYLSYYNDSRYYTSIRVCKIVYSDNAALFVPLPAGYYMENLSFNNASGHVYSPFYYNCVVASMDVLLQGQFNSKYKDKIKRIFNHERGIANSPYIIPNSIYSMIFLR